MTDFQWTDLENADPAISGSGDDVAVEPVNALGHEVERLGSAKVDKVDGKGLSTEDYTTEEKDKLAEISVDELVTAETEGTLQSPVPVVADTLKGISNATAGKVPVIAAVDENGVPTSWGATDAGGGVSVQSDWTQNNSSEPDYIKHKPTIPTATSQLTNDSGFLTQHQDISGKEDNSNKVTSINSQSTDTQYPSAKCVYDLIGDIESALVALRGGNVI